MLVNELERYSTPDMAQVWSAEWKYRRWVEIEIAAARAQGAPLGALAAMSTAPVPGASDVAREERQTHHDVVAFLNCWRYYMSGTGRSWTHRGLTSSDIVDTANGMRLLASGEVILTSLVKLRKLIGNQAIEYKDAVRVGRTHGQTAEVTTWGWRLVEFTFALDRAIRRVNALEPFYAIGKMSGPVGDYKRVTPNQELTAMIDLGLHAPRASSQIVMRDAYVDYMHAMSQVASVIESIALEVRLSSRTDTGEVAEGFGTRQRGSSAMPHKRNPIGSEQLTGLARVVRAQVEPVAQGVASHHERDISHSSVERLALQTASVVTDYMVNTCFSLMANLRVYPEVMRARVMESQELLSAMIKDRLVENGTDPQSAYDVVYYAFQGWGRDRLDGPDGLVKELTYCWHSVRSGGEKPGTGEDVPDFDALVHLLDEPEKLVGNTQHAYTEVDVMVNPKDLPF